MGNINWSRVILGGVLWAVVYSVLGTAGMYLFMARLLREELEALGRSFELTSGLIGFLAVFTVVGGIFTLWLYAAIRPRYGPGPKTAVIAAVAAWFAAGLAPLSALNAFGLVSMRFMAIDLGTALVMFIVATLVGAWQYKE